MKNKFLMYTEPMINKSNNEFILHYYTDSLMTFQKILPKLNKVVNYQLPGKFHFSQIEFLTIKAKEAATKLLNKAGIITYSLNSNVDYIYGNLRFSNLKSTFYSEMNMLQFFIKFGPIDSFQFSLYNCYIKFFDYKDAMESLYEFRNTFFGKDIQIRLPGESRYHYELKKSTLKTIQEMKTNSTDKFKASKGVKLISKIPNKHVSVTSVAIKNKPHSVISSIAAVLYRSTNMLVLLEISNFNIKIKSKTSITNALFVTISKENIIVATTSSIIVMNFELEEVKTFQMLNPPNCICAENDLIAAGTNSGVVLFSEDHPEIIKNIGNVKSISITPDGKVIAGLQNGDVIYDATGKADCLASLDGSILCAAPSPNNTRVICCSDKGSIQMPRLDKSDPKSFKGIGKYSYAMNMGPGPFVAIADQYLVKIFNIIKQECVESLQLTLNCFAWNPDRKVLLAGNRNGDLEVYEVSLN